MSEFLYWPEVRRVAVEKGLDPDLVTAVCLVESSGNTRTHRYEPAFFLRYMASDPRWKDADPTVVSASYGLMQVMYLVALEYGFHQLDPPNQLFIPHIGLEYGCRVLKDRLEWVSRAAADVGEDVRLRAALASYNGGKGGNAADHRPDRNAKYAEKVLATLARVRAGEFV